MCSDGAEEKAGVETLSIDMLDSNDLLLQLHGELITIQKYLDVGSRVL